jgi:enoyl-CoA hydratase/carnithine racemase
MTVRDGTNRPMFNLAVVEGIARLSLSRPGARNAIPAAGWAQLADAVAAAEAGGARLLILSGLPGGPFCAGADIADLIGFRSDEAARAAFRPAIRRALDRLRDLPIPTLVVIEGACFGAGVALAIACDIRFAGPGAQFAITPAKLGISYPQEDIARLNALVGAGHAARLLLGAQVIEAAEAERIGLVERYVPSALDQEVDAFAAAIVANDPASLAALKRGVKLASAGIAHDQKQDSDFDAMLASDALAQRLASYKARSR